MQTATANVREPDRSGASPDRRVLIVDDDRDFADALHCLLTIEGYVAVVAYSANQARKAVETFDAQVAILDYRLAQTTGVELAASLKQRRPAIVCILATASAEFDTAIEALRRGIYDYFRKPLHDEKLLATLERCFERLRLEEEKRAAEEALHEARKMEAVGQVAGGVAHHFNNLLMVIQGNLWLVEARLGDDREARCTMGKALVACDRAASITHGLLNFTSRGFLRPEPADLAVLALQAGVELPAELASSVSIRWATARDLWPVMVDHARFRAALQGLIRNAAEAMPGGELTIAAANEEVGEEASSKDDRVPPGRYVVVTVVDRGPGMAPEVAERAFEPFYSAKGLAEKVGLGLSMVYGFAKQSDGHVTLDSEEGRGTTVRLYLPPAEDTPDQPGPRD